MKKIRFFFIAALLFVSSVTVAMQPLLDVDQWIQEPVAHADYQNPTGCTLCAEQSGCRTCEQCGTIYFNFLGTKDVNPLFHPLNIFYGQEDDTGGDRAKAAAVFIDGEHYTSAGQYLGYAACMELRKNAAAQVIRKGFKVNMDWYTDQTIHIGSEGLPFEREVILLKKGLCAKFTQHEWLKELLLATGHAFLVYECETVGLLGSKRNGKNLLGVLLMEVRRALQSGSFIDPERYKRARE